MATFEAKLTRGAAIGSAARALTVKPARRRYQRASQFRLEDLVGRRVRTTKKLAGIAAGTEGVVTGIYQEDGHRGILVRWSDDPLGMAEERFPRDEDRPRKWNRSSQQVKRIGTRDQTAWLDVIVEIPTENGEDSH